MTFNAVKKYAEMIGSYNQESAKEIHEGINYLVSVLEEGTKEELEGLKDNALEDGEMYGFCEEIQEFMEAVEEALERV